MMQCSLFGFVINSTQLFQYFLENSTLKFCFLYDRGRKIYLKYKLYGIMGQIKEYLND